MADDKVIIDIVPDVSNNSIRKYIEGQVKNVPVTLKIDDSSIRNLNKSALAQKDQKAFDSLSRQYTNATEKLKEFKKVQDEAGKSAEEFARKIGFSTTRLAAYLIPAAAIFQISNAFNKAKDSIVETNAEVNKLTQILDGNASRSSKISDQVLKLAERYGQAGKDILAVTNTIAQAGNKFSSGDNIVKTVEALSKTTLAATFGDIKDTTEGTIAALNQFNLSGERTVEVLDLANQLAKKFAFESGDLFTAVKSGGAAFSIAGGNIKEFAATVGTIRQLTRLSSATIGTGINTIALRSLRPDVVAFTDKLTDGKIRNADGTLKNITQRFVEIAKATKDFDDEKLAQVINVLSGDRQGKLLVPFLRDLQKGAQGASVFYDQLEQADKSAGSLSRDAITGLQRLDVQLASIGSKFDQVFKKLGDNKGIQGLIADFAKLSKGLADIIDAAGPLIPTLLKLGTIKLATTIIPAYPEFVKGVRSLASDKTIAENARNVNRQEALVSSLGTRIENFSPASQRVPRTGQIPVSGVESSDVAIKEAIQSGSTQSVLPYYFRSSRTSLNVLNSKFHARSNLIDSNLSSLRDLDRRSVQASEDPLDNFFNKKGYSPDHLDYPVNYLTNPYANFNTNKSLGFSPITPPPPRFIYPKMGVIEPSEIYNLSDSFTTPGFLPAGTKFSRSRSQILDPRTPLVTTGNFGNNIIPFKSQGLSVGPIADNFTPRPLSEFTRNAALQQRIQNWLVESERNLKVLKTGTLSQEEVNNQLIPLAQQIKEAKDSLKKLSESEKSLSSRFDSIKGSGTGNNNIFSENEGGVTNRGSRLGNAFNNVGRAGRSFFRRNGGQLGSLATTIIGSALLENASNSFSSNASPIQENLSQNQIQRILSRNTSNQLAGAAFGGAASGLLVGSQFGPIGSLAGAGLGAVGGIINSSGDIRDRQTQGLGAAASSASTIAGFLNLSSPLLGRIKGSTTSFNPLSGDITTESNQSKFLNSESGQAFRQKLRSFASEEANKVAQGNSGDSSTVFANLSERFTKQFESQGFGHNDALSKANKLAAIALEGFATDIDETIKTFRETRQKIREQVIPALTITNYLSDFDRNSRAIGVSAFGSSVGSQFKQGAFGSLSGDQPTIAGADQIAKLLFEQMQTAIGRIDPLSGNRIPTRNAVGNVVDKFSGGLLSPEDKEVFGDIGSIQQFARTLAKIGNSSIGATPLDESNQTDIGIRIKQILEGANTEGAKNSLTTERGKNEFDTVIKEFINSVEKNPSILRQDPTQLATSLLKGLPNSLLERFQSIIGAINEQLRQNIELYKEQRTLQQRQIEIESRTSNLGLQTVEGRRSLGANSFDIIAGLNPLISSSAKGLTSTSLLGSDLTSAQKRLTSAAQGISSSLGINDFRQIINQSPDQISGLAKIGGKDISAALKEFTDAQIDVAKAHDAIKDESIRMASSLSLVRARFDELNKVIESTIAANQKIGLTPISQQTQGLRGQLQFNGLTGGLQDILKSNNVGSIQELSKLSDKDLQKLISGSQALSGSKALIDSSSSFGSLLGGRQAGGFRQGVTNQSIIDIIGFAAGAGTPDAFGKTQDVSAFRNLIGQRNDDFNKITDGEKQQILLLQTIKNSIREGLKLPPVATNFSKNFKLDEGNGLTIDVQKGVSLQNLGETIATAIAREIKNGSSGSSTTVKFDGNFNITGFENTGKDVVVGGIITKMMESFYKQLDASDPAQAALKEKLSLAMKQFNNY